MTKSNKIPAKKIKTRRKKKIRTNKMRKMKTMTIKRGMIRINKGIRKISKRGKISSSNRKVVNRKKSNRRNLRLYPNLDQ